MPKTKVTSFTKLAGVGIVFNQNILHDRVFYTNENHSAWNTKLSKRYQIPDNTELTKILYLIYLCSLRIVIKIKKDTWILSAFQKVCTKKEPMLCEAVYVIISSKETKTIKQIKPMYPNIQMIYSISRLTDWRIIVNELILRPFGVVAKPIINWNSPSFVLHRQICDWSVPYRPSWRKISGLTTSRAF